MKYIGYTLIFLTLFFSHFKDMVMWIFLISGGTVSSISWEVKMLLLYSPHALRKGCITDVHEIIGAFKAIVLCRTLWNIPRFVDSIKYYNNNWKLTTFVLILGEIEVLWNAAKVVNISNCITNDSLKITLSY